MMRRARFTSILAACAIVLTAVAAYAAAGGLDPSFSGDGKLTTPFGARDQQAEGVVVLPDDRVVAVGSKTPLEGPSQFALARYLANGGLDTSFGGDGKVTTGFTEGPAFATDVALAGNGDYIVVGYAGEAVRFAIARYNPNGTLDTTFSGDGKRTIPFGGGEETAWGVAITPAGRIVVVGTSETEDVPSIAVARLTATGALDTSFSTDGKLVTRATRASYAYDVALVGGKAVVVGRGSVASGDDSPVERFLVFQFTATGELDPAFGGGDGWVTTPFGSGGPFAHSTAYGVQIRPDGRIVVAGAADLGTETSNGDFAVARYLSNGALDTSFSSDGKVTHHFGASEDAQDLALQPDGKIVLAGSWDQLQAVVRLKANGGRDTTFSGDGLATIDVAPAYEAEGAQDIAIAGDGKLVVVGYGFDFDVFPARSTFTALRILGS